MTIAWLGGVTVGLTLLLSSCDSTTASAPSVDRAQSAPVEWSSVGSDALPPGVDVEGRVVGGARWSDRTGENLLLLTQTGKIPSKAKCGDDCFDAEISAYHFVRDSSEWSSLWKITDSERECLFDLYAGFIVQSLSITDLDANRLAESSFLYKTSCRSDVSPARLKLVMYEGSQRYVMSGSTTLPGSPGSEAGMDAAFDAAPPAFKLFAQNQWSQFVVEDKFEQFD